MEKIAQYYLNSKDNIQKVAKKHDVDRKKLSKFLKINYPNYSTLKFINICNKIHNFKYNYELVKYTNARQKVEIICPKHGKFSQEAFSHTKGIECSMCGHDKAALKTTNTKEQFLQKAILKHGDIYDYSKTVIIHNRSKITITCKIHGDFTQTPDDHKQGKGCLACARENIGWTKTKWKKKGKNRTAILYIIKCFNDNECFIKIGRTFNSVKRRFASKSEMPYNWKVIQIFESNDYDEIWNKEILFHRKYKDYKYLPKIHFEGKHECFKTDILEKLKEK